MMHKLAKLPIRRKLLVIAMVTSCLALFLSSSGFIAYEAATFRLNTAQRLQLLADVLGANSTAALAFGDQESAHTLLKSLSSLRHVEAAAIYDKNGRVFARYFRDPTSNLALP